MYWETAAAPLPMPTAASTLAAAGGHPLVTAPATPPDRQVAAFANAAGTGGGPIMVPLFNVVVGFALKPATGLSQVRVACYPTCLPDSSR